MEPSPNLKMYCFLRALNRLVKRSVGDPAPKSREAIGELLRMQLQEDAQEQHSVKNNDKIAQTCLQAATSSGHSISGRLARVAKDSTKERFLPEDDSKQGLQLGIAGTRVLDLARLISNTSLRMSLEEIELGESEVKRRLEAAGIKARKRANSLSSTTSLSSSDTAGPAKNERSTKRHRRSSAKKREDADWQDAGESQDDDGDFKASTPKKRVRRSSDQKTRIRPEVRHKHMPSGETRGTDQVALIPQTRILRLNAVAVDNDAQRRESGDQPPVASRPEMEMKASAQPMETYNAKNIVLPAENEPSGSRLDNASISPWSIPEPIGLNLGTQEAAEAIRAITSSIQGLFGSFDGQLTGIDGSVQSDQSIARRLFRCLPETVFTILRPESHSCAIEVLILQLQLFISDKIGRSRDDTGDRILVQSLFSAFIHTYVFGRPEILPDLGMANDRGSTHLNIFRQQGNFTGIPENPESDRNLDIALHQRRRRQRHHIFKSKEMDQQIGKKALALATRFAEVVVPWKDIRPAQTEEHIAKLTKTCAPVIVNALKLKGRLELGTFPVRFEFPACGVPFDDAIMMTDSKKDLLSKGGVPTRFNEVRLTHRPAAFFRMPKARDDAAISEWWEHGEEQLEEEVLAWPAQVTCYDGPVEMTDQQRRHMIKESSGGTR